MFAARTVSLQFAAFPQVVAPEATTTQTLEPKDLARFLYPREPLVNRGKMRSTLD